MLAPLLLLLLLVLLLLLMLLLLLVVVLLLLLVLLVELRTRWSDDMVSRHGRPSAFCACKRTYARQL